jgi:hypothetical protein
MEISVVDARKGPGFVGSMAGPATALFSIGEVYMTSAKTMVDNVLNRAGTTLIDRLNILDHGNPNGIELGDDWITINTLEFYRPTLEKLRGHFNVRVVDHESYFVGQSAAWRVPGHGEPTGTCGTARVAGTRLTAPGSHRCAVAL